MSNRLRCELNSFFLFFFFNDTATTEIYTLSLHDALPISGPVAELSGIRYKDHRAAGKRLIAPLSALPRLDHEFRPGLDQRSEEHTSELQSRQSRMPSSA